MPRRERVSTPSGDGHSSWSYFAAPVPQGGVLAQLFSPRGVFRSASEARQYKARAARRAEVYLNSTLSTASKSQRSNARTAERHFDT